MKKCFLLAISILLSIYVIAQSSSLKAYHSVAAYSKNFKDVFSFASNPAVLSELKQPGAGICAENRYLIKELDDYFLALNHPIVNGGVGLSVALSGDNVFSKRDYSLSYGRKLSEKLILGVQLACHQIAIAGYGSTLAISGGIGAIMPLTPKLQMGASIANYSKGGNKEPMHQPTSFTLGLGYEVSEKLLIGIEFWQEGTEPVDIRTGIYYAVKKNVFLRTIIITNTGSMVLGWGVRWRNTSASLITSYHPQLGLSPGLLLTITKQNLQEHD